MPIVFRKEKARRVFEFIAAKRRRSIRLRSRERRQGMNEEARIKAAEATAAIAPVRERAFGAYKTLAKFDLNYYLGKKSVFLVNRGMTPEKRGVYYLVRAYDDAIDELQLTSPYGTEFQSKLKITTPDKYAMVIGPLDATEIPKALVLDIQDGMCG